MTDTAASCVDAPARPASSSRGGVPDGGAGRPTSSCRRGAVTVLVSHRFSIVRSADLILVIHGGGVTERGRHDQPQREGLHAELYTMQARAYR